MLGLLRINEHAPTRYMACSNLRLLMYWSTDVSLVVLSNDDISVAGLVCR